MNALGREEEAHTTEEVSECPLWCFLCSAETVNIFVALLLVYLHSFSTDENLKKVFYIQVVHFIVLECILD